MQSECHLCSNLHVVLYSQLFVFLLGHCLVCILAYYTQVLRCSCNSFVLHCPSPTVHNIVTSKISLPCCGHSVLIFFKWYQTLHVGLVPQLHVVLLYILKQFLCSYFMLRLYSPHSLCGNWSFEAEIVPWSSCGKETSKLIPLFIVVINMTCNRYTVHDI